MSELPFAALHGKNAGKNFQQRRFPRAVRAHKHDALTALRIEIYSAINNKIAIRVVDIFQE